MTITYKYSQLFHIRKPLKLCCLLQCRIVILVHQWKNFHCFHIDRVNRSFLVAFIELTVCWIQNDIICQEIHLIYLADFEHFYVWVPSHHSASGFMVKGFHPVNKQMTKPTLLMRKAFSESDAATLSGFIHIGRYWLSPLAKSIYKPDSIQKWVTEHSPLICFDARKTIKPTQILLSVTDRRLKLQVPSSPNSFLLWDKQYKQHLIQRASKKYIRQRLTNWKEIF